MTVRSRSDPATAASASIDPEGVLRMAGPEGRPFATFERLRTGGASTPPSAAGQRAILSRFAVLHAEAGALVLESAFSDVRVALVDPRSAAMVAALARPVSAGDLADATGCGSDVAGDFLTLLVCAELASWEGCREVDHPGALWDLHDLLLHRRSRAAPNVRRSGRRAGAVASIAGASASNADASASTAGASADPGLLAAGEAIVTLHRLAGGGAPVEQITLGAALAARRSRRTFGGRRLSLAALGEFLFYSAGVSTRTEDGTGAAHRPYPSGGGCYPLEIHPLVVGCDGLAPGLYWYDAGGHRLCFRRRTSNDLEALVAGAVPDPRRPSIPHVVLVIGASFARVQSAYEAIAYALILKEVGALMQTMSLVAEAMGLAGCALGWGDAALFARAAGLPALVHGSVGEFALGTRSADDGGTDGA